MVTVMFCLRLLMHGMSYECNSQYLVHFKRKKLLLFSFDYQSIAFDVRLEGTSQVTLIYASGFAAAYMFSAPTLMRA
jgi:hypothetical protein